MTDMAKDLGVGVLSFTEPQNSKQIHLGRGDRVNVEYLEFGLERRCLLCLLLGLPVEMGWRAEMQKSGRGGGAGNQTPRREGDRHPRGKGLRTDPLAF